jgi:hypothetical protein
MTEKKQNQIAGKLVPFHLLVIGILIAFDLGVSAFVRYQSLFFIPNEAPMGFQFGLAYSIIIVGFIFWALIYFKIFIKHPIITILIVSGALSNFSEKWIFYNAVTDYITIGYGHFNLADVEIWTGLIILNFQVWILDYKSKPKVKQPVLNNSF